MRRVELSSSEETSAEQTQRIQTAIDELAAQGGGKVSIGKGTWRVTTLFLRSGIRLHLEQNSILQAETDLALYPPQKTRVSNKDQSSYHLIFADNCQDISIEGEGAIDGQDTAFWTKATREEDRPYGIFDFFVTGERISPLIQILGCRRVRVEGITIRRAPGWTLHCFDCDEVRVRNICIRNHLMGPNTDGITINGCRNAFVHGCDIVTGDDAIGIKASNSEIPCRSVVVSDCIAETNCGAFILGAETAGGIYDVAFNNCIARACLRLIAIEMWDAGHVENIVFSNITGSTLPSPGVTCERAIYIDIQQFNRPQPELGRIRNVICSNVFCKTRGRIVLTAQDGARLENISLRDVHLDVPEIEDPRQAVPSARSMQNSNFNPHTRAARAAVVADNVNGLILANVSVRWPLGYSRTDEISTEKIPMHALCLRHVEDAEISSPRLRPSQAQLAARMILPEREYS